MEINKSTLKTGVCFYTANLNGGGAERVFLNSANFLASYGITVNFVLNNKKGPYLAYLDNSIKVHELKSKIPRGSASELASYLNKYKPDVAISTLSQCNYALILASVLSKWKPRIIVREANSFLTKRKDLSWLRLLYERIKVGLIYRLADTLLVNSEGSKKELSEAGLLRKKKIQILYNPLNIKEIKKQATKNIPKKISTFLEGAPYLIAVGRLEEAKGFDNLLKAFSKLKNVEYKLIILGEGDKRSELEQLIKNLDLVSHVMLPGYVINPYPVISGADLFVLSSRYEGMPNVLLEALVLDLKIVATDCPNGPKEMLKNGQFGKLVPVDDPESLSDAIEKQLKNRQFSNDLRSDYIQNFDLEVIGSELLKILTNN
jgi:glycosyltransferase involved in cell wall biosynthesis